MMDLMEIFEHYALVRNVSLIGYGSTTFRREAKERGAEPDECWCVGAQMRVRDRMQVFAIEDEQRGELRVYCADVLDQAVKNGVLVVQTDGDDVIGMSETGDMLHRAGDAERDVQLGIDGHPGRADEAVLRHPAGVGRDPAGAVGQAERGRDLFQRDEGLGPTEARAAGDDARRFGQIDGGGIRGHEFDELGVVSRYDGEVDALDRSRIVDRLGAPNTGLESGDHRLEDVVFLGEQLQRGRRLRPASPG